MNKIYVTLGILAIVFSVISGARGEVVVTPLAQETCCDTLKYNVVIRNTGYVDRAFNIKAESLDSKDVWASLEPSLIVVPAKSEEQLTLFVRPTCGLRASDYRIKITSECSNQCVDLNDEVEVKVTVKSGCVQPQPPQPPQPQPPQPPEPPQNDTNTTGTETPTGGAVASSDSTLVVLGLIVALIIIVLIVVAMLKR